MFIKIQLLFPQMPPFLKKNNKICCFSWNTYLWYTDIARLILFNNRRKYFFVLYRYLQYLRLSILKDKSHASCSPITVVLMGSVRTVHGSAPLPYGLSPSSLVLKKISILVAYPISENISIQLVLIHIVSSTFSHKAKSKVDRSHRTKRSG
jgi:hypothetical protein